MEKDFSSPALQIYRAISNKEDKVEERDALALLTLALRSFYEQGYYDGREHERSGLRNYQQ